ncbi:mCG12966 [Mus musculus]|nr:mCG12966 [Mus musculus]
MFSLFTLQILSPFLIPPQKNPLSHPLSPCSLTHPLLLPCPGIPLHLGMESSQDQRPLLSLMSLKAILCYIFGWRHEFLHVYPLVGLVPGSSGGYWLVHIVVPPIGLQTPSASCVLSLAPPLWNLCSVQWMAVSLHFCICQVLAEPLRRQLHQAPVSKHLLASTIVSGFGIFRIFKIHMDGLFSLL